MMIRNEAINFRKEYQHLRRSHEEWYTFIENRNETDKLSQDEIALLARALRELPEAQREVIFLRIYENLTFDAIATILDISANTVASRYRYGMDKLRKRLNGSLKFDY